MERTSQTKEWMVVKYQNIMLSEIVKILRIYWWTDLLFWITINITLASGIRIGQAISSLFIWVPLHPSLLVMSLALYKQSRHKNKLNSDPSLRKVSSRTPVAEFQQCLPESWSGLLKLENRYTSSKHFGPNLLTRFFVANFQPWSWGGNSPGNQGQSWSPGKYGVKKIMYFHFNMIC